MTAKSKFSEKQLGEIKQRLSRKQPFHDIAREMRISYEALRRQFDEEYRLMRNATVQRRRDGIRRVDIARRFGSELAGKLEPRVEAPQVVLEDCARRRMLSRPSLTAEFFGDPLPGYSALDGRQGQQ